MRNNKIDELYQKRKSWVQTTKDNNFDKGISNLLTELYPHNAHFIYELLQNAEDAEATEISFELYKDSLWVRHNGRSFTYDDVAGITSIGEGTKANDINKIGKFGVGFKAVFSYTNTPVIYSNDFNFEIHELVIPVEIEKNKDSDSSDTLMKFPFNNPDKSRVNAYSEIKRGLKELDGSSLLFLNNLKTISYSYEKKLYRIDREEINDIQINIANSRKGKNTEWLRFKKNLPGSDKLFVSIAFNLGHNEKKKKETIQPVDGQVFIFFPAEKETSSLKFHIHAPFASTVARDSIKDIDENDELRDLISDLTIESLKYFKNNDLLDFDFLRTLPIDEDNLSDFYLPIQKGLIDCFNNNEYILTDNNSFKCGIDCYRSSAIIKKVIDIDVLRFLKEIEDEVYWIKNPSQLNSREDKFLQSLNINEFSNKGLIEVFYKIYWTNTNISKSELEIFLNRKGNAWIKQLYELLFYIYNIVDEYNYKIKFLNKIIKLQNGKFNSDGNKCFFDSSSNLLSPDFNIVHSDVYETNAKAKNQKSKKFLEILGVDNISLSDEIELILKGYNDSNFSIQHTDHLNHLALFLKYFEETNDSDIFHDYPILLNSKNKLVNPNQVLIDSPWEKTGLQLIKGSGHRHLLNDCYKNNQNKELLVDFLRAVGANFTLPIEKQHIHESHPYWDNLIDYGTQSKNTIDEDFFMHRQKRLMNNDYEFSLLVWNSLSEHTFSNTYYGPNIFTARYRRVFSTPTNKAPSTLFLALEENAWIPDKNLNFYKPQDISQEMLHDDFIYNNENGWLTKIGFGENILKNQEDYVEKEKLANEISGLHLKTLKKLKERGYTDEKILKFIEQEEAKEFEKEQIPDLAGAMKKHYKQIDKKSENPNPGIILDEEEYRQKAQKKLDSNLKKSKNNSKKYLSTQKVKVGKAETRDFLYNQYKGYCQICGFTFDQRNDKGKYFEVLDWFSEKISKQKMGFIEAGSSLCLCANCHSAIKHGDFNADKSNEISGDLKGLDFAKFTKLIDSAVESDNIPENYCLIEMDMYKMPIHLLNEKQNIFYTEEHFMQFYNMLTLNQDKKGFDAAIKVEDVNISNIDLTEQEEFKSEPEPELIENDSDKEIIENREEKREEVKANSKVHIKYNGDKLILKIQLSRPRIGSSKNNSGYDRINKKSPLAKALIGHVVGNVVEVDGVNRLVEIIDVINE